MKKCYSFSDRDSLWENTPQELRYLILSSVHALGTPYATHAIIEFLLDHSEEIEDPPEEVAQWIDVAIEASLFPLESHDAEWASYSEEISLILKRFDLLIGMTSGSKSYPFSSPLIDLNELSQKSVVYHCVHSMYTENWDDLSEQLEQLLRITESNVAKQLTEENVTEDDWSSCHYPGTGTDRLQKLNWLAKEMIPGGRARQLLTAVYEDYCTFLLDELTNKPDKALATLHKRAEVHLRGLCDLVLDEISENLMEAEVKDEPALLADRERFEAIFVASDKRSAEASASIQGKPDTQVFHRRFKSFTEKLQKLIRDYPTLPIVVNFNASDSDADPECCIAYVHDPETGEFEEKIIAVYQQDCPDADLSDDFSEPKEETEPF